jgi:hypothetical protein
MQRIHTSPLGLLLAVLAVLLPAVEANAADGLQIKYDRIAFELPAGNWQQKKNGDLLQLRRSIAPQRNQFLSVWKVNAPRDFRTYSVRQHAKAYLDSERKLQRDPSQSWQGFAETTVAAGMREFYAMTYRVTWTDPKVVLSQDGQFVLFFPADFASSQVFYCFLWVDYHTATDVPVAGDMAPLVQELATASPAPQPPIDLVLARSMGLAPAPPDAGSGGLAAGREVAARTMKTSQSAEQHSSLARLTIVGESSVLEWRIDAARGDRYHVLQSAGKEYDEWVTVGKDHYRNAGLWFRPPANLAAADANLNRFLSPDKFLRVMGSAEPAASGEVVFGTGQLRMLEYNIQLGPDFVPVLQRGLAEPAQVRLWIDVQTHLLVKGEVTVRDSVSGKQLRFEQTYAGQQIPVRIEPPLRVLPN